MNYQQYKPPQILSDIVQHYWSLDGDIPADETYIHRTLANFCPELIFHYGGVFRELTGDGKIEQTFVTGVHGQTDRIRRFTAVKSYGIFGVILQPFAIPLLFGISSTAIKNELIDLESLLKQEGKDLADKMMLAKDNTERLQLINRFLVYRLKQAERQEIVYAAHQIYNQKGLVNVTDLTGRYALSQRQFERKFKEHIGFSAKSFARLVRFKSLIGSYKKGDSTLTKVAYDFGYYDQAHFILDFKQFTGYSPNAYFSGEAKEVFYAP
jgi:AraC-like DNA-binding protein